MILVTPFRLHPNPRLQDREYDSWDVIADYVFQVILPSLQRQGTYPH